MDDETLPAPRGRRVYSIDDLPDHLVAAILAATVPDELEDLDEETEAE
jgi:hypothetical protein